MSCVVVTVIGLCVCCGGMCCVDCQRAVCVVVVCVVGTVRGLFVLW